MTGSIRAFYYTCRACNREISHKIAINLIAEKSLPKVTTAAASTKSDAPNSNKSDANSHLEDTLRARLQQQLSGPTSGWMMKQHKVNLSDNFRRIVNMMNSSRLPCPHCHSRGHWIWRGCV
ncbi:hypothetical protein BBBOND_0306450 [Babesia bigemina]|uniref:Uncharacterized protein n=1 Tax=Babesia bigemina TaxID=5866 RepID=A0A061D7S9_BABBI|nr:hypothetical protein BBBOND_0306450 [Babesia bigemina]CDR96741.1 hypothetical protein BBBOND_0306450 [Babesia bigemina]|eukprot:XP_012768927.1 hypothetical protein BBBOND_0306450 [Babesia bigemina]